MPGYKRNRNQLLTDLLSGAEIDPLMMRHCEAMIVSHNPLARVAVVGFLLDDRNIASVRQRSAVQYRAKLWIEAMPEAMVQEIEYLALVELERQIRQLREVDVTKLDPVERSVVRHQRMIIEAVNEVLIRAKRTHLNRELDELDDLLPQGY